MAITLSLTLPDSAEQRINALLEATGLNHEELFRNAIRLFEAAVQEREAGATFLICRANTPATEWQIFEE